MHIRSVEGKPNSTVCDGRLTPFVRRLNVETCSQGSHNVTQSSKSWM